MTSKIEIIDLDGERKYLPVLGKPFYESNLLNYTVDYEGTAHTIRASTTAFKDPCWVSSAMKPITILGIVQTTTVLMS